MHGVFLSRKFANDDIIALTLTSFLIIIVK